MLIPDLYERFSALHFSRTHARQSETDFQTALIPIFLFIAGSIDQEDMISDILRELSNHNER